MRTLSYIAVLASLVGFASTAVRYTSVTLDYAAGMLNPSLDIHIDEAGKAYLTDWLLVVGLIGYIHLLIERVQSRLEQLKAALTMKLPESHGQSPTPGQRLMRAIRMADIAGIRQWASVGTLRSTEEATLNPFELADLYGNQDVINELSKAYEASLPMAGEGERIPQPRNRFALSPMTHGRAGLVSREGPGNNPASDRAGSKTNLTDPVQDSGRVS